MLIESPDSSVLFPLEATPDQFNPYNILIGTAEANDALPLLFQGQYRSENPDLIFESSDVIPINKTTNLDEDNLTGVDPTQLKENLESSQNLEIQPRKGTQSDTGGTIKTAKDLGKLSSKPLSINEKVGYRVQGKRDVNDYYKFTVKNRLNQVNISLDGLKGNANLQLLGSNGKEIISTSTETGKTKENIFESLPAGTYYLRVYPQGADSTAYHLSLDADSISDADGTAKLAQDFKLPGKIFTAKDDIGFELGGVRDQKDYYELNLTKDSEVSISLDGLTQNANIKLLGKDGKNVEFSSSNLGKSREEITTTLDKGKYYVLVEPYQTERTSYNLSVAADAQIQDKDGSLPGKKLNIGKSVTDSIGVKTGKRIDQDDYYNFELKKESEITLDLQKLTQNADIELYGEDGTTQILASNNSGNKAETISSILDPGKYYVRIKNVGTNNTEYRLSLTANTKISEKDDQLPGTNLGDITKQEVNKSSKIGFQTGKNIRDTDDYYQFKVAESSNVNINLDGLNANAKLELLGTDGQRLGSSNKKGTTAETINKKLEPGTYYVHIEPNSGKDSTAYKLKITADQPLDDYESLKTAKKLGALNQQDPITETNAIGFTTSGLRDKNDYYNFSLTEPNELTVDLENLKADANVRLLDASGKLVDENIQKGTKPETISKELKAGDYYLQVLPVGTAKTNYNLIVGIQQKSDLSGVFQLASTTANPEDKVDVKYTVSNTDVSAADGFRVGFYLSADSAINPKKDILLDSQTIKSLAGYTLTSELTQKLTLPNVNNDFWKQGKTKDFYLGMVVDDLNAIGESNEKNNLTKQLLSIAPAPADNAGNSRDQAKDLGGIGSAPQTYSDWLGNHYNIATDSDDYYKFSLTGNSTLNLNLSGLTENANLYLYNSEGSEIGYSYQEGKTDENILTNLTAGTYYVLVNSDYYGGNTTYNLKLSATAISDSAGNDMTTAQDIGTLGATAVTKNDWVGDIDTYDYYKFSLTGNSTVNLNLSGLTENADLYLYNSEGSEIGYSYQGGKTDENILTNLTAGTYYVLVNSDYYGGNTTYNLKLSATAISDSAGNDMTTAQDIGTLGATTVTKNDWVGDIDTYDYYKFSLTGNSTLNLNLSGLTQNADLYLYNSEGSEIGYSYQEGKTDESILTNLTTGTYYVLVNSDYYGGNTTYNLKLSATAISDSAGNDMTTAQDIGTLGATAVTKNDWVGDIDTYDYYKFSLTGNSTLNLNLSGLTQNADLYLYNSASSEIGYSYQEGKTDENILTNLTAGTYYVLVNSDYYGGNTTYNLGVSATALTYSPANKVGNTLSQNLNIGALGTTQTFNDFVGNPHGIEQDENDFYTFSIPSASTINLKLTGLTANADLYLYDSNDYQIGESAAFSNVDETISKILNPGTYRIKVSSNNGANTGYNLQATASALPNNGAGESFDKALPLGILSSAISYDDWVGYSIDSSDYYQFQLAQNRVVNVNLSNVSDSISVNIYDNSGDYITSDLVGAGETKTLTTETLPPGLYYVTVDDYYTDKGAFYRLSIS